MWISDEKLLVFASLIYPSKSVCLRSYIKHSSQCFITISKNPRSSSKILRYASYFELSSRCLICDETLCLVFDVLRTMMFICVFSPITEKTYPNKIINRTYISVQLEPKVNSIKTKIQNHTKLWQKKVTLNPLSYVCSDAERSDYKPDQNKEKIF